MISDKRNRSAQSAPPRLVLAALVALLLSACATQSYMGISLVPGQASAEVQQLARRAQAGDKHAQFDLGMKFEEGIDLPQNRDRALRLYIMAATDGGSAIWIYSPSVSTGAKGRIIPVYNGSAQIGSQSAKDKLIAISREAKNGN